MQMEAEVLRILQDVETEVDDEDDMETMRKIMKMSDWKGRNSFCWRCLHF